jgi:ParB family chromosome partitioning protein
MKKSGLGKGLSALIDEEKLSHVSEGYIPNLPVEYISPNPYQPRLEIKPESLVELSDSIREHGIIEPILVTKKSETHYELIAGERRLQASKLAGVKTVPVVVKEATPQDMLEIAVIENIQREDLNALEEALAFNQLIKEFNLSYDLIAKKVGLSRSAIANKIRLLALPNEIKKGLLENKISEGHARALLGLKKKDLIIPTYKAILKDHLSVRAVEELVRRLNSGKKLRKKKQLEVSDAHTTQIEKQLREKFGSKVTLSKSTRGGKIIIPFKSDAELDELTKKLL